jgi:predicted histidine transporter YuiF (NhaC family)
MDSFHPILTAADNLSDTSALCLIIGLLVLIALLYRIAQRLSTERLERKRADERSRPQTAEEQQLMDNITSA